jgi:deazaflavin-dependent oxidoreductase (nitroreductase family)
MERRNQLVRLLRVVSAVPIVMAGTAVGLYLLLLGFSPLLRVKRFSDRIRRFSKTANRPIRRIAGTRAGMLYFNLGALHHVGRRSGRTYVTPLSAYRLGDGFVLGVAYPQVDWCRNVLAAGKCTLTWDGKEYALERPELIPAAQAMKAYPALVKPFIVGPGTKTFLRLHRAGATESVEGK